MGNYLLPPSADYYCQLTTSSVELAAVVSRAKYYCIFWEFYDYHFTTLLAPGVLQSSRKTLMHKSGEMGKQHILLFVKDQ